MNRLVLFDFDDTIVDTQSALLAARKDALRTCFGGNVTGGSLLRALEVWRKLGWYFSPNSFEILAPAIAAECGWDRPLEEKVLQGQLALQEGEVKNLHAMTGAAALLTEMARRGIKLGLVSNGRKDYQQRKLAACGLRDYFDEKLVLITPSDSSLAKPSPAGILTLCRRARILPANTVFIGDRLSDVVAGRLAGCKVIYFYRLAPAARTRVNERMLSLEIPTYGVSRLEDIIAVLDADSVKLVEER